MTQEADADPHLAHRTTASAELKIAFASGGEQTFELRAAITGAPGAPAAGWTWVGRGLGAGWDAVWGAACAQN